MLAQQDFSGYLWFRQIVTESDGYCSNVQTGAIEVHSIGLKNKKTTILNVLSF